MQWSTKKVRSSFLDFFKSKGHTIVDSAPIVLKDDPTLMFTNAGMNQFKSVFVGNEDPTSDRVADTQKCLRVSGKHNDLEEVGRDHYHHTMFEMLGNWSFGDYFKEEAIDFAWELLTEVYGLDKDRLYVTIFEGDSALGVALDDEAKDIWKKHIDENRILPFSRKDNFWEMGETGPCGPCSEIHYDMRSNEDRLNVDGKSLVNADHPDVIEIWNLVFMQFNSLENGELEALKDKHIDTGMGLERLTRALQGVQSNYDIDLFKSIIESIEEACAKKYEGGDSMKDIAFRVIADHVRAISFCIADGQLPSSAGAGYVVRRVLRRAIRYGYSQLSMSEPFIYKVADALIALMGDDFSELQHNRDLVLRVIREEEQSFLKTLDKGLDRLDAIFKKGGNKQIPGTDAFELYDTYGFPIDLTQLIAEEQGWSVDMGGFKTALEEQKERSKKATKTSFGDWTILNDGSNSEFLGYDQLESETTISKYRVATVKGKEVVQLVLDKTPFYAESGGQVGDKGILIIEGDEIAVFDTKKENNEIIHFANKRPAAFDGKVIAKVNGSLRKETMKNHTATHLLHHALRSVLGEHVEQKGSLVAPDRLRFDFSHFEKVSEDQLATIEQQVRETIQASVGLEEKRSMPIDEAKAMGAMALFGEKYGNEVRVIKFGESVELCGGTHVSDTSDIGGFKIISESSVASGVRRVEALTGAYYASFVDEQIQELSKIDELLGHPKSLSESVAKLQKDVKTLQKQVEMFEQKEKGHLKSELAASMTDKGDLKLIKSLLKNVDGKTAKDTIYGLSLEHDDLLAVVAGHSDDKPYLIVGISKPLSEKRNLDASSIVRQLASHIQGGGGGQKFLAMAGGKNKQGLQRALDELDELIEY